MNRALLLALGLTGCLASSACKSVTPEDASRADGGGNAGADASDVAEPWNGERPRVPEWHRNAVLYEVNLRHFTPEGTFAAFEAHIDRLKDLGVDILWFMPVHEISQEERKGTLGSPYAVRDYRSVNPEYGTFDDFKHMIDAVHAAGLHAIIDWVPNHTGWDHAWITDHPDWFTKGPDGDITDPVNPDTGVSYGWTDVADLDYDSAEMRQAMIEDMAYWVREANIDGFRMDVAHQVPVDFWQDATNRLYEIKPLFMLAEAEEHEIVNDGSFVADYAWEMGGTLNEIAQGARTALVIDTVLSNRRRDHLEGYQIQYTSNHDENAWNGTEMERMGDGHQAFAVLTATFDGMPLIYNGQESAMNKRLAFFEKDEVEWGDYSYADFYRTLFELKHRNQALWNGDHGADLEKIGTGNDEQLYAYIREKEGDRVVVVLNLSGAHNIAVLEGDGFAGDYTDVFSGNATPLATGTRIELPAWQWRVFEGT